MVFFVNVERGNIANKLQPKNINVGDVILSGSGSSFNIGNTLPLEEIP
jgi:ribosomal protein L2